MIFKYIGKLEQEVFDEFEGTIHVCNGVYLRKVIYAHMRAHTHTHTHTHTSQTE